MSINLPGDPLAIYSSGNQPEDEAVEFALVDGEGSCDVRTAYAVLAERSKHLCEKLRGLACGLVRLSGSVSESCGLNAKRAVVPLGQEFKFVESVDQRNDRNAPALLELDEFGERRYPWADGEHIAPRHQEGSREGLSLVLGLAALRPPVTVQHEVSEFMSGV